MFTILWVKPTTYMDGSDRKISVLSSIYEKNGRIRVSWDQNVLENLLAPACNYILLVKPLEPHRSYIAKASEILLCLTWSSLLLW